MLQSSKSSVTAGGWARWSVVGESSLKSPQTAGATARSKAGPGFGIHPWGNEKKLKGFLTGKGFNLWLKIVDLEDEGAFPAHGQLR